jgi:hypothetical protein
MWFASLGNDAIGRLAVPWFDLLNLPGHSGTCCVHAKSFVRLGAGRDASVDTDSTLQSIPPVTRDYASRAAGI